MDCAKTRLCDRPRSDGSTAVSKVRSCDTTKSDGFLFHYSTNIVPFIIHDSGFIYDMKFFNFAVLHRKHLTNVLPFNYLFSLAKPDKKVLGSIEYMYFLTLSKTSISGQPATSILFNLNWLYNVIHDVDITWRHKRSYSVIIGLRRLYRQHTIAIWHRPLHFGVLQIYNYVYIYRPYTFLLCIQLCNRLSKNH